MRSGFTAEDYRQKCFSYSSNFSLFWFAGLWEWSIGTFGQERAEFALNYFVGTGDSLKSP